MASSSSSSKRRKLDTTPPTKGWISNLHFETFCIKRVISTKGPGQSAGSAAIGQSAGSAVIGQIDASIPIISDVTEGQSAECGPRNFPPAKDCLPDYEVYDLSGGLEPSPPPCHWTSFLFDQLKTFDIVLQLDNSEFTAHRGHLAKCCRYFQGMFSSYMKESVNSRVRLHGVDEPSFRAILSSFYSGFLSVCSKCVLRLLRTGTFLQSDVIIEICQMYIISHMNVKSVFQVLEVAAELAYSVITEEALKLICANLGPEHNLVESEEFLDLPPSLISSIASSNHQTNCSESELAAALFRWAARTWQWYDMVTPRDNHVTSAHVYKDAQSCVSTAHVTSCGTKVSDCESSPEEISSSSFLDDSGIVLSDEYIVELPPLSELFDIPSPPQPPGVVAHPSQEQSHEQSHDMQSMSRDHSHDSLSRRNRKTYKKSGRKNHEREAGEVDVSRKSRKRKRDVEEDKVSPESEILALHSEIEQVLFHIEYANMEPETLHSFLDLEVVRNLPSLHSHIRRTAGSVWAGACVERGAGVSAVLCYHRCYRSLQNPLRSTIVYYQHHNRWHVLDNSLNVNLISAKSLILNDILYMFGMYKPPGQAATPRGYRFNQFTGYWREISSPPCSFNSSARIIAHNGSVLLIGCTNVGSAGFASFQQKNVKILQYLPQKESWKELEMELPITNHQLQRYVNSIISHDGLLYYISKNKLCSFDIDVEEPTQTEVAIVSHMFSNISNYWLYGYKDKILLLGGLCTAQGGGSWQNREILIFSTTTRAWTVINNEKPSPMYEMMSGAIYNDQLYTVSHAASAGDHIAKVELFDLELNQWKKGLNLKYESPIQCMEYSLTTGSMLIKPTHS